MKRRIDELEELAATVDTLTESPSIAEHINDEAIEMIGAMMRLEPNSQTLSVTLQNAEQLADTYRNHSRPREIYSFTAQRCRYSAHPILCSMILGGFCVNDRPQVSLILPKWNL